jgi:hypothetical protein
MPTKKNIEQLLKHLSADRKPYPKDLLDARRTVYLSQVTSVVSSGPNIKKGNGQGQGGSPPTSAPMTPFMKVVLATLVAANFALVTYLAVSIYENWDKVQGSLLGDPSVSEISPVSPEVLDQAPELETTPEIAIPPAETVAPVSTPEPSTSPLDDSQPSDVTAADSPQVGPSEPEASTPEPDENDNPGKHLGQTPHGPGDPPGQDNQDNSQNNTQKPGQDNTQNNGQGNQDGNKDKKDKDNNP